LVYSKYIIFTVCFEYFSADKETTKITLLRIRSGYFFIIQLQIIQHQQQKDGNKIVEPKFPEDGE